MLNETINAILKTEAEADAMVKEALEEAKTMVVNADAEAEKIRANIKKLVKEDRISVAMQANADGDKQYEHILLSGEKQAAVIVADTDVVKAVAYIKEKVLSRYVNN